MKKKKSLFLCAFMVTVLFATSCTTEMDTEGPLMYTPQKKAAIENLAKEYGLNVVMKNTLGTRSDFSIDDIEEEFKMMSSIIGQYNLLGCETDDSLEAIAYKSDQLSPVFLSNPANESGTDHLDYVSHEMNYYRMQITINFGWDITTFNKAWIESVSITENTTGTDIHCTLTSDSHIQILGAYPGTIIMNIGIQLSGSFASYFYRVSGSYSIASRAGDLSLI